MKVMLINPESPMSYWSFPEQMKLTGARTLLPPLGLITVAALLPQDWEIRLVDLMAQPVSDLDLSWPDVVMITGMYIHKKSMISLIQESRKRNRTVVVGGPYASSVPQELLSVGCDFVVRGEAENTVSLLVESLKSGSGPQVIENPEKPDLTESPIPRFDLIDFRNYSTIGIQTSRGCPFDCEFCDIVNLYGSLPRYKSPQQVVKELDTIYRRGWRDVVFICDDNFIGSKKHAKGLLKEMNLWMKSNSSPFSFMTQASINLGQDLELIDLMTEPNFSTVFIGLESPDENVLASANKFQNIRNPLEESIDNINRNGMTVLGSFILGLDGEQTGVGARISSFVDRTNLPVVMFNKLEVTPKTKLWDRLETEGRLRRDVEIGDYLVGEMNFVASRPQEEIQREFVQCWDSVYETSNFLRRTYNYYLRMRPTRKAMGTSSGSSPAKTQQFDISRFISDIKKFIRLCWRQGALSESRIQFWKQLVGILRKNPSRLIPYLTACSLGEDMFRIRQEVLKKSRS